MKTLLNIKMVKLIIVALPTFVLVSCSSKIEKASRKFCSCLEENKEMTYKERLKQCGALVSPIYNWDDSREETRAKDREMDSILALTCPAYVEMLARYRGQKDWALLKEEQESKLPADSCGEFKKYTEFYYLEGSGDTTYLTILDGMWIDRFNNNKYHSYLEQRWTSPCDFEIEMIETTEPKRKAAYKKGDVFKYRIINRKKDCFIMMVQIGETKQAFKLYVVE